MDCPSGVQHDLFRSNTAWAPGPGRRVPPWCQASLSAEHLECHKGCWSSRAWSILMTYRRITPSACGYLTTQGQGPSESGKEKLSVTSLAPKRG